MEAALPQKYHGMAPEEFTKLVDRCRTYLIGVARERRTATYKEVMDFLHVDRFKIPYILGDVTRIEKEEGRPSLSALVLYADRPEPGPGFAAWSKDQLWLNPDASDEDSYVYWLKEMHASWVRWA